jgi:hypothetical protein
MANASGFDLAMSYQGDPLPTREDVVSRHRVLKDAYNSIDEVRLLVDRFVSFFGRQDRFRVAGGSDRDRAYLQGSSGVMHTSEYLSHLTRDAQVLGNGFATFHTTPSPAMSLQDPSLVEVTAEDSFWRIESSSTRVPITDHILHLRGIEQMNSAYGISMLEPLVASYEILRTTLRARETSLEYASGPNPTQEMIDWARDCEQLHQQTASNFASTVQNMYFLPLQHWAFEPGDLYFTGYERYPL